jgi:hypothetical protein
MCSDTSGVKVKELTGLSYGKSGSIRGAQIAFAEKH